MGIIAYFAKGAGLSGKGAELATSPSLTGGNFSSHFDRVTGLDQAMHLNMYRMRVPGYKRSELGRTLVEMDAMLPHEMIAEEVASVPGFEDLQEEVVDVSGWEPAYRAHPVVRAHAEDGALVVPLALYLDGVAFLKRDNVLGFWLTNLVTSKRHLFCVVRKRDRCRCGCRGWDTVHEVLSFVHWCLRAMADGHYPAARHDGTPWAEAEEGFGTAGQELGYYRAVVMVKGGWSEYARTFWISHLG